MIVRNATFADVEAMLVLGRLGHAGSELSQFAFDEVGAKYAAAVSMADPARCAFVAEHSGSVVGVLLGMEEPYAYLHARYATDLLVFANAPGAGALLMRRFIEWAFEQRKVDRVLLGDTYGSRDPDRASGWYELLGARRVGGTYVIDREREP